MALFVCCWDTWKRQYSSCGWYVFRSNISTFAEDVLSERGLCRSTFCHRGFRRGRFMSVIRKPYTQGTKPKFNLSINFYTYTKRIWLVAPLQGRCQRPGSNRWKSLKATIHHTVSGWMLALGQNRWHRRQASACCYTTHIAEAQMSLLAQWTAAASSPLLPRCVLCTIASTRTQMMLRPWNIRREQFVGRNSPAVAT